MTCPFEFYIYGPKNENELKIAIVSFVSDFSVENKEKIKKAEPIIRKITNFNGKFIINIIEVNHFGFVSRSYVDDYRDVNNEIFSTFKHHKQNHPVRIKDFIDKRNEDPMISRAISNFYKNSNVLDFNGLKLFNQGGLLNKLNAIIETNFQLMNQKNVEKLRYMAINISKCYVFLEKRKLFSQKELSESFFKISPFLERKEGDRMILAEEMKKVAKKIKEFYFE